MQSEALFHPKLQNFEPSLEVTASLKKIYSAAIAVQESSSQKIISDKLSATDDVGPEQLVYSILREPVYGRVEFVKRPGNVESYII